MGKKTGGSRFTEEESNYDYTYDKDNSRSQKRYSEVENKRIYDSSHTSYDRERVSKKDQTKRDKRKRRRKKSSRSWLKIIVVLFIFVLIIGVVFLTPLFEGFGVPWGGGRVYPEKADFTIQRTISFENLNRGAGDIDYNLTLAVPEDIQGNDIQMIEDMNYNIEPMFYRRYGTEWKSWDRNLRPRESEDIRMTYDVKTTTVSWGFSGEESGTIEDIPDDLKEQYNKNQWKLEEDRNEDGQNDWMIQPQHTEINSLAEEIVEDENNIYDKSKAIYEWIDNNIEYEIGRPGELPKHATWVLESGSGDCDEQAFLYASLSRAVGIPAWMELGVLYDRVAERWGPHGWIRTKFVQDDGSGGWVNIDTVNDQFYFRDAMRITTWVDEEGEDQIRDFYHYISWTGGNLNIEDDFEDVQMETEGRVLAGDGWAIPGFGIGIAGSAVMFSVVLYPYVKGKYDGENK